MSALAPVLARILLRYLGGALFGAAFVTASDDPDVQAVAAMALGAAMSAAAEGWMWAARRYGWST